jgi:DNA-binding MarR family transcriptional regulator
MYKPRNGTFSKKRRVAQAQSMPADYALVLQQVDENGEEDFTNLAESLSMDRKRLSHIIHALQHKGLVQVSLAQRDIWIRLSSRGRRFMDNIWPEPTPRLAY